jgi:hypothetical protein
MQDGWLSMCHIQILDYYPFNICILCRGYKNAGLFHVQRRTGYFSFGYTYKQGVYKKFYPGFYSNFCYLLGESEKSPFLERRGMEPAAGEGRSTMLDGRLSAAGGRAATTNQPAPHMRALSVERIDRIQLELNPPTDR